LSPARDAASAGPTRCCSASAGPRWWSTYLAHESCPVSAGIYTAGGGRFARLYVAATDGCLHPDYAPAFEDVAANWAAINDEAGYYVPTSTLGWSARYLSHLY
jgi:hypothetical protein